MRTLHRALLTAGALSLIVVPAAHASGLRPRTPPGPAVFRVGASVVTINPTYPVYLGGYGAGPAGGTIQRHTNPLTGKPEDLTVRAVSIQAAGQVIELASVDSQGWFAGYEEGPYGISDVRSAAAAFLRAHGVRGAATSDIIVSSLHEHAVPSLYGIFAPAAHNLAYLRQVAAATTRALEQAWLRAVPATITWGAANAPWLGGGDIPEGNEFEGWRRDGSLLALWARDARTGETIATYVSEPAYPNIVYGPADLVDPSGKHTLISTDFPAYAEAIIEDRLGGTAVLASGSLANQASPVQADIAPSPNLPRIDGLRQTRAFDDIMQMGAAVANVTFSALAHGHPVTNGMVGGAEQTLTTPVTNPALIALGYGNDVDDGAVWTPVGQITTIYPDDRANTPPYAAGPTLTTWVTALRLGNLALVSEPGEFIGSIHEALASGIYAPDGVFVVGAAQDFLGYEYPAYVLPFTALGGDELIFGPSVTLGDQVVTSGELAAQQLGFPVDLTSNAELSVLENDYAKAANAGAYLLPEQTKGDLDPTGGFPSVLLAAGSPPRTTQTCDNPALLFTPSGCSLSDPSVGAVQWHFGDGAGRVTRWEERARALFSPYVRHRYSRPGTHLASVTVTSDGTTDTASVPITVYPPLEVTIARRGDRLVAVVRGGDGHALYEHWTLPDGSAAYGTSVPATVPENAPFTVTVVDGTGTTAGARAP